MSEDPVSLVVPGQKLGSAKEFSASGGTYIRKGYIYASLVGEKEVSENKSGKPAIAVYKNKNEVSIVPQQGNIITGKITRVQPRQCTVQILCVGDVPLKETFRGLIRVQDVRETQIDQVEMYKCFRPEDIVRAEVISLGDSRSYFLSVTNIEYGVIFAKSVSGFTMVPISWDQMQCPVTKVVEHRKVAKVS